jgi:hypothetical protein
MYQELRTIANMALPNVIKGHARYQVLPSVFVLQPSYEQLQSVPDSCIIDQVFAEPYPGRLFARDHAATRLA